VNGDPEIREGWVDAGLDAELPGIRVAWCEVEGTAGPSPPALRERLRELSDKLRGPQAVALRGRDVPHAYRVFFRHVGIEPDLVRIPVEELVVERLMRGGFPSRGRVEDAVAIACVETGVPVWALDADRLAPPPGVRPAVAGDEVGGAAVPEGRLVLADADRALAVLFTAPGAPHAPGRDTRRIALVTVVVPNVPALFAEEALWIAGDALGA
jgi:DNA/RNA-binding domain of Phe-tRNA-synthetase-like protein